MCRVGEELFLYMGCKVGYWRGEVTGLLDDVMALRPTIFSAVPRVFERICSGVNAKLSASFIKSLLYNIGFRWKLAYLKQGVPLHQASSSQLQHASSKHAPSDIFIRLDGPSSQTLYSLLPI